MRAARCTVHTEVSYMDLVSKWVMPDGRGVVDNRCDARFVVLSHLLWLKLSQSSSAILPWWLV